MQYKFEKRMNYERYIEVREYNGEERAHDRDGWRHNMVAMAMDLNGP